MILFESCNKRKSNASILTFKCKFQWLNEKLNTQKTQIFPLTNVFEFQQNMKTKLWTKRQNKEYPVWSKDNSQISSIVCSSNINPSTSTYTSESELLAYAPMSEEFCISLLSRPWNQCQSKNVSHPECQCSREEQKLIFPSSEASAGMEAMLFPRRRSHLSFAFSQSSCCHKLRCSARCTQCLPTLFSPKLLKSNLTEKLIVLNLPFRALKHRNKYEISISRSLLDTQPYLFTRSAVPLAPQGPKDYGTCGNGKYMKPYTL